MTLGAKKIAALQHPEIAHRRLQRYLQNVTSYCIFSRYAPIQLLVLYCVLTKRIATHRHRTKLVASRGVAGTATRGVAVSAAAAEGKLQSPTMIVLPLSSTQNSGEQPSLLAQASSGARPAAVSTLRGRQHHLDGVSQWGSVSIERRSYTDLLGWGG